MGSKKTLKEQMRDNKRMIDRAVRDLDRERRTLETQQKKIEVEIKKMAKEGQMARMGAAVVAAACTRETSRLPCAAASRACRGRCASWQKITLGRNGIAQSSMRCGRSYRASACA